MNIDMSKRRLGTPSNGSLHSTFTTYGSHLPSAPAGSRGQSSAQRRPLRSISQNSSLPPSPGLLVSMLKTATEMGDVGTFPMQKQPVTPTAYHHQLPRSRPDLVAATPPPKYTPKRNENYYYAEDGRPFRSYRDTTSEIISLYAYDNQPSYFGSGSPMLDDSCHRSYSITSNSSRCLPSRKASAILQSHSSGGEVQRPRSPFPYPTRLKRPGVRSASPAVTDNGCVDYSRMIELDRVSQRTVHNSYKPNSLKWARRPPPLSSRPDYSRSAASLPLRASPNPYYRSRTPSSSHSSASRYGRFERHPRMPLDHGERSPSLSSIVGMYRPPSSAKNSRSQNQRACQFYYDYSEDFDNPTVRESDIEQQPITHAERYHGDGSGEDECSPDADVMANLDCAVEDENCSQRNHKEDNDTCSSLMTSAERSPLNGEHGGCTQAVSRLGEVRALRKLSRSAPPSSQQLKQSSLREDREAQHELASLVGDSPRSNLLRLSKTLAGRPVTNQVSDKPSTRSNGDDADCSREQSLPDFASIFGSFDLLDRSPYFQSTASLAKALDATGDTRSIHSADHASHARHIHDVSSMDTSSSEELVDESGFSLSRSAQDRKLDILSPEPISPVRGLKVKNSIPQLMKALPPLPSKLSQYVQNAADNSLPRDAELAENAEHAEQTGTEGCRGEDLMQDGRRKVQTRMAGRASPSKFKVRVKPSTSQMRTTPTGTSNEFNNQTQPGEVPQDSDAQAHAKPKLKIKLSRTQLGQGHYTIGGALPRANRLKNCNSLADFVPYSSKPPKMTDSIDADAGGDLDKQDSHSDKRHQSFDGADELPNPSTSTSPQPSDPFNIPYPSTSDDNATNNHSISSSNKDTLVPRPSCSPDTTLHHENGLRKKMSMFRLRLVESFSANGAKKDEKAEELARSESHISIIMASKDSETNMTLLASHASRSNKVKSDWMANRVKRWAMDAKRAVRSYVRRTLDRSPRRNE
ncbi:hypothetical protein E4U55_007402 [Claviceps digitariae]|nr:hypothetical protein E4U55_007402 [Claviceps digitariae]